MGFVDDFHERHRNNYNSYPVFDIERTSYHNEKLYDKYLKTEKISIESKRTIIDNRNDLFNWDNIPGDDSERFIEFLNRRFGRRFGFDWLKSPRIEKIDGGKTVKVFDEKNFLLLKLNNEKTKISLKFDDGRSDEFIAKMENSTLNIYDLNSRYAILKIIVSNTIKLCKSCKEINKCHLKNDFIDLCPKIISNLID